MLVFSARSCTSITKGKRPWACFWVQGEVAAWGVAASRGRRGQPRAGLPVEVVTLRARQSGDWRAQPTVPKGSPLRKEHPPKAKASEIGPPLETGPVILTTEADRAGKRKKKAKHSRTGRTQKDPEALTLAVSSTPCPALVWLPDLPWPQLPSRGDPSSLLPTTVCSSVRLAAVARAPGSPHSAMVLQSSDLSDRGLCPASKGPGACSQRVPGCAVPGTGCPPGLVTLVLESSVTQLT